MRSGSLGVSLFIQGPQGPPHMPIHLRTCLHLATNDNVTPSTSQSLGQPCSLDTHKLEPTQPRAQDPNPNTDCLGRPCVRTGLSGLVQKLTGHSEKLDVGQGPYNPQNHSFLICYMGPAAAAARQSSLHSSTGTGGEAQLVM